MTVNKPMTGEQLDELMTVAVNMQRDAETDCNRPSAMFAYAVQVAVLELRNVRNDAVVLEQKLAESQREFRAADATIENLQMQVDKLAAENAGLKAAIDATIGWQQSTDPVNVESVRMLVDIKTPSTSAFLAEVRAQGVEMFADSLGSPYVERGKECYQDGYTHAIERIKFRKATEFSAQLRKGGATEEGQSFLSDEDCQAFVKAFTKGAAQ